MTDTAFTVNNNDKVRNRSAQRSFIAGSELVSNKSTKNHTAKINGTAAKFPRHSLYTNAQRIHDYMTADR